MESVKRYKDQIVDQQLYLQQYYFFAYIPDGRRYEEKHAIPPMTILPARRFLLPSNGIVSIASKYAGISTIPDKAKLKKGSPANSFVL